MNEEREVALGPPASLPAVPGKAAPAGAGAHE